MDSYLTRSEQQHEARRVRRRIWFTVHVLVYVTLSLSYALMFAPDPLLIAVKSMLLTTIFVHAGWLYMIGLYETSIQEVTRRVHVTLAELNPQPVPLLSDGDTHLLEQRTADRDFWFRWHDLS